jgi:RNA polymerase sigma-70 factor (ECF subfamily)
MLTADDQSRFVQLWTIAQPTVSSYIHSLVRDRDAAGDVLQETAMVLYRRFAEYDHSRPFVAWALGIARYQAMSLRRDAARSIVTFDDELLTRFTAVWAEIAPALTDRSVALQSCLEGLAARPRHLLRLRYVEGLTSDEICQRLGGKPPAIRVALQRIREKLRQCVDRQLDHLKGANA